MSLKIRLKKLSIKKIDEKISSNQALILSNKNYRPYLLLGLFIIIGVASSISLFRDLNTFSTLKPFGVLQDIFAQVTGGDSSGVAGGTGFVDPSFNENLQIIDSWQRCQVVNPKSSRPIRTVAEVGGSGTLELENKGGINNGSIGNAGDVIDFVRKEDITISYTLAMFFSEGDAGPAADFVRNTNDEGMMPVIRLCYPQSCGFDLSVSAEQVINFYRSINDQLGDGDYQFIGMVGPNEPSTGDPSEMEAFKIAKGDYATLVARINEAASALQDIRVDNGGSMYITQGALNMTITLPGLNDRQEILFGSPRIEPDLFDFISGNSYNIAGNSAYHYYTENVNGNGSVRDYVENNGLFFLLTEFGFFPSGAPFGGETDVRTAYNQFCNDETVDGILFFRPSNPDLPSSIPRQEPPISPSNLKRIIDGCSSEPQRVNGLRSSWLNCNFDSCVSKEKTYEARSVAVSDILCEPVDEGYTPGLISVEGCVPDSGRITDPLKIRDIYLTKKKNQEATIKFGDDHTVPDQFLPGSIKVVQLGATAEYFLSPGTGTTQLSSATSADAFAAVIMVGANDCANTSVDDFATNLVLIGERFEKDGVIPILTTFPRRNLSDLDPGIPSCEFSTLDYNSKIKSIAEINGWPLLDAELILDENVDLTADGWHIDNYTCMNRVAQRIVEELRTVIASSSTEPGLKTPIAVPAKDQKAWLKIECNNSQSCSYGQKTYTQVRLPLKSLGSTTITNSARFKSHTPSCAEIARAYNMGEFDALNQFAGKLTDQNGSVYPMPWLGSVINCMAELSKVDDEFARRVDLAFDPHPFSRADLAKEEAESDYRRGLTMDVLEYTEDKAYNYSEDFRNIIPEERTVCIRNNETGEEQCHDNINQDLKVFKQYDPFSYSSNFFEANLCNDNNPMTYVRSRDELLPGPEIQTSERSSSISGGDVCWMYGQREITPDISENFRSKNEITCITDPDAVYDEERRDIYDTTVFPPVYIRTDVITTYCRSVISDEELTSEDFHNGTMEKLKNDDKLKNCLRYIQSGDDLIEYATKDYGSDHNYNIEGIYDALYMMYEKIQTQMSERGRKILFRQNFGWKGFVDTIIRDINVRADNQAGVDLGPYLYVGEYNTNACENVTFFDNETSRARGSAVKTDAQYYSWTGYLDIIQEWMMAYVNNTQVPGEYEIDNPFYNPVYGSDEPNDDVAKILVSDVASQYTSVPLLTCDQVEVCKSYTKLQLVAKLKTLPQYASFDDAKIESLADTMCPFDYRIPEDTPVTCIERINRTRPYDDELAKFLCSRGYSALGYCENICKVSEPVGGTGPAPITGVFPNTSCPLAPGHTCFQGPYGGYTHCVSTDSYSTGLPLDMNTAFPAKGQESTRDVRVFAPEDGTMIDVRSVSGQGQTAVIRGSRSGITYTILHLQNISVPIGGSVTHGRQIAQICQNCIYDYNNWHIHVRAEATIGGVVKQIDPYSLYGEILKCFATRPPAGVGFQQPTGDSAGNDSGYCQYRGGARAWTLNDNNDPNLCPGKGASVVATSEELVALFGGSGSVGTGTGSGTGSGGTGTTTGTTVTDTLTFPVSKTREIPGCVEPTTVEPVATDLPVHEANEPRYGVGLQLIPEAKVSLEKMMSDMKAQDPGAYSSCAFNWGYRSAKIQETFNCAGGSSSSVPCACHSEHQLGTSIDFYPDTNVFGTSQCYQWLRTNANKYGFVESYTGRDTDYYAEPWHWRWLPGNHANVYKEKEAAGDFRYPRAYLESIFEESSPVTPVTGTPIGNLVNPTCPVAPSDFCKQGPLGDFSHMCSARSFKEPGMDLSSLSGSRQVFAPEDGEIISVRTEGENQCIVDGTNHGTYGGSFVYRGGSGIYYTFQHVSIPDSSIASQLVGKNFTGGQRIVAGSTPIDMFFMSGDNPCWDGAHVHIVLRLNSPNGPYVDPYQVFSQLGCSSTSRCSNDNKCDDKPWVSLISTGSNAGQICNVTICSGGVCTPRPVLPGALECNISTTNESDPITFANSNYMKSLVQAYNYDNADNPSTSCDKTRSSSFTWIANVNENDGLADYDKRRAMTQRVIDKAKEVNINPKLALTLWLEESAGSAVGRAAMGCLYVKNTGAATSCLPGGENEDESWSHLEEQIECVASYVNHSSIAGDFSRFMCTYSGEPGWPMCTEFVNNPNFPVNVCKIYSYL